MDCRQKALDLLSRREHSCHELRLKLQKKAFDTDDIESLLSDLMREGLLSDARFCESYVRHRANRGFGPLRIRAELMHRQVADDLIENHLHMQEINWTKHASLAKCKKFGMLPPSDVQGKIKQMAFLQYRGFTSEQIRDCVDLDETI